MARYENFVNVRIMKNILRIAFTVVLAVASVCAAAQQNDAAEQLQKLNRFYRYLNNMYVDEVEMAPLVENAIRGMLSELDPHSVYLDAEAMRSQTESFEGEFSGIGIEYNILNDSIIVVNTVAKGPAETVGLRPNDRIVTIDGENAVGLKRSDVPPRLRGPRGSKVEIGVARKGVPGTMRFAITRDNIPLNTVDAAFRMNDDTGYIKVNRFGRTTMREFREAMDGMKGIKSLILDLSGNVGGLLDQAVEMAGFFLPEGALVVSTEGRAVSPERYTASEGNGFGGNVVVLINENSASASEIVAGALQDWDRAVVVGRDSFGKGLVQQQIALGDGSAVMVTVARYHTPTGRVIQRPYENGHKEEYYKAFVNRLRDAEQPDSVTAAEDRPVYETILSRRKVYGGGGISPDVRIEADTTDISDYMMKVVAQGVYNDFIITYMDSNRDRLAKRFPDFGKFDAEFAFSDGDMSRLVELARQKGVEFDEAGFSQSRALMENQLAALVAQRLYTSSEFYRYLNPRRNEYFKKAMEIVGDWDKAGAPVLKPE